MGDPARVFVASAMPTDYPYKLQKPSTVSDRVRDTADCFIMDSGIGDDVSNSEVIELAITHDADYVVGKDFLHEHDRTTESVLEFLNLLDDSECDATPLIPLQPPYHRHYKQLEGFDHYVLGGMVVDDVTLQEKINWIKEFRQVEPDAYTHALGVGGGIRFVRQIAGRGLVDSVDCSTPERAAMFGCVLDDELRQNECRVWNGDGASKRNIPLAEFNSWQIADVWERESESEHTQTTLC